MFKGKIRTFCGNEFTVFFLKDASLEYTTPDHPLNDLSMSVEAYTLEDSKKGSINVNNLNWMDVNENSAGGGLHSDFLQNN